MKGGMSGRATFATLAGVGLLTIACGGGYPLDVDDSDAWIDSIYAIELTFSSGKWVGTQPIRLGDTAWVSFAGRRRDGGGIGGIEFAVQPYDTAILRPLPLTTKEFAVVGGIRNPDFVWRAERLGSVPFVFYNASGKTRDGKPVLYRVTAQVLARP